MARLPFLVLAAAFAAAGADPAPRIPAVTSNIPVSPPGWATLERKLLEELSEAAIRHAARYTRSGGTLIWKTSGGASLDDLPESFYNFPLLYALGGDERLRELSFRLWDSTTRQLTHTFPVFHKEFPKHGDWFHIGEGFLYFYLLALADPTDAELVARARRYAGFYMNEDPEAPNYDARHRIIRSGHTGSLGPHFPDPATAAPYSYRPGMSSYGLPLQDLPGISSYDDLKDETKAAVMGRAMAERIYRGDVPANLGATTLAAHAYMLTGEGKYARWLTEYAGAWRERTRANGGITPDNVGLGGKPGEYHSGKWWGGLYGWMWPHGYYNVSMGVQLAAANAMLISRGEPGWAEMPRSNLDAVLGQGRNVKGAFVVPYKRGDKGWFSFRPLAPSIPIQLWYVSMDPADRQRVEKLRAASSEDWHTATGAPFPNNGYARVPEPLSDCFNCDLEGLVDWNRVIDIRSKEDAGHEAPWFRYVAGENPGYPEAILRTAYGQMNWRMGKIRDNVLLIDYDPRKPEGSLELERKLENAHEHHWATVNPVTTEALVQLMLGAPQLIYNGGLLHARLRYFDPERRRPGLARDVAALVSRVEPRRTVVELINLSPFDERSVILQAGTFGEHRFTRVSFERRVDAEPNQPSFYMRAPFELRRETMEVNGKLLEVRLPPGTGLTLDSEMERYRNQPSYAFPWHGERAPIE